MFVKKCAVVIDTKKLQTDIETFLKKKITIRKWEYSFLENKDGKCICVIYMNFGNCSVNINLVSEWFDVPLENIFMINEFKGKKLDFIF